MLELMMAGLDPGVKQAIGQMSWTTPGTFNWVVPDDVTLVCALVVGAGSRGYVQGLNAFGGVGGAVRWQNNISVTPGQTIQVIVGHAGAFTYTSTANIADNSGDATLMSSVLGLSAGPQNKGSALGPVVVLPTGVPPTTIGGGNGGIYDVTGYNKFNRGGSAGEINTRSGVGGGNGSDHRGYNVITNAWNFGLKPGAGIYNGRDAGGGGTAVPLGQNTVTPSSNQVWAGGHGAVRLIWGKQRWYPDKNITDK